MDDRFDSDFWTWQHLKAPARSMRHAPTPAEAALWNMLRNRQLSGIKFRRQYTIGRFIVDFVCLERKLVIEVDGEIHQAQVSEDKVRQRFLEDQGFSVMRFTNAQVLQSTQNVQTQIIQALTRSK